MPGNTLSALVGLMVAPPLAGWRSASRAAETGEWSPQHGRGIVFCGRRRRRAVLSGVLGVAMGLNACASVTHSGPRQQDMRSPKAATLAVTLPQAPVMAPDPWMPYAVEKEMGAEWCGEKPGADSGHTWYGGLNRPCLGLLPQHLADVLVAIPTEHIFIPSHIRADQISRPQPYLALPGRGRAPDFMADVDMLEGIKLRSFEGIDPSDTVYLVIGPFDCIDDDPLVAREGEYVLETEACRSAHAEPRIYKWSATGSLRDVTGTYLPIPVMTSAEQALTAPFQPHLDTRKLQRVPVMRWTIYLKDASPPGRADDHDYDPVPMPDWVPESRRMEDRLHLGFLVWNGETFELRQRVPSELWPESYCDPLRPDRECNGNDSYRDEPQDPFVDKDSTRQLKGAAR